ncbi:sigma-70 family RNA polymerase sigma factor [Actinomyces sp. 186855]|nr:sigma-70 family RNA polymerase sigma factor [Actinomyces sp. AC-20-1]MCL3789153.1 sigma-70 family RNA polymerase sigma factor [Actinomyces sp. 187325]MCL3792447.1 sigma-70 family RNA polymerase sigma factor [Actinomyces sp. 186855]MCL3794224.1 sigma-70 family RNA polymerase sigma factor [Actinomyces sp. 217892]
MAWSCTPSPSGEAAAGPYHPAVDRDEELESDAALLDAVAMRDEAAFARLYDRWAGRLLALIVHVLVDPAQSEEVLQEVMLEIWRDAGSFDRARGSARGWMAVRARRRAVDRVRQSQAARDREQRWPAVMPDADVTAQQVEDAVEAEEVRSALARVGEPHRSTLLAAYVGGLTHAQIARRTGVPLGTVKSRIRDGVARLRREMGLLDEQMTGAGTGRQGQEPLAARHDRQEVGR